MQRDIGVGLFDIFVLSKILILKNIAVVLHRIGNIRTIRNRWRRICVFGVVEYDINVDKKFRHHRDCRQTIMTILMPYAISRDI